VPFSSFELLLEGSDGGFSKISEVQRWRSRLSNTRTAWTPGAQAAGRAKYKNIVLKRGMVSDAIMVNGAGCSISGAELPAVLTLRSGAGSSRASSASCLTTWDDDDDGDGLSEDALLLLLRPVQSEGEGQTAPVRRPWMAPAASIPTAEARAPGAGP